MTYKGLRPAGFALMASLVIASTAKAQTLCVANFNDNTVVKITASGVKSTLVSGLNQPFGIAFSPERELYISNFGDGTITRVSLRGSKTTFATGLGHPTGITFAPDGNLYVADYADGDIDNGRVVKITPRGVKSDFITGLTAPGALAFSPTGDLCVSNYGGGVLTGVYKISPALSVSTFISTGSLNRPYGVAFAGSDLFVANYGNGRITKKSPTGSPAVYLTNLSLLYGAMDTKFWGNDLFVSNIVKGTVTRITPGVGGAAPTLTTYASGLNSPAGIAFAP